MKTLLRIALALLLIGIGGVIVFGIVAGDSASNIFSEDNSYTYEEKTYSVDELNSIIIAVENKRITVMPSENDEIKLEYYVSEKDPVTVTTTSSTIEVENETEWFAGFFNLFAFLKNPEYSQFNLYLPSSMELDLSLSSMNGEIIVSDLTHFKDLTIWTSNGEISLDNVNLTGSLSMHSSNGRLNIDDSSVTESVVMYTSNGRVHIDGLIADEVEVTTSNGDIDCQNVTTDSLDLTTSNGVIEVQINGAFEDYYLKMATTNGSYYLNGSKVVQNSYHDSLDKVIDCHSSNGNIRVNFSN